MIRTAVLVSEETNCHARAFESFCGKFPNAFRLAAGFKRLGRLKHQADARKRFVKRFHRDAVTALGGVIEKRLVALEAVQHDKVVKVPVNDTGELAVLFEVVWLVAVAFGGQPVASCRFEHVLCVGSVAGHAAIGAHLLQRNPFFVICQNHGQRRRATFQRFHLHDHGNLGDAPRQGLLDLCRLFAHACHLNSVQKTWEKRSR